MYSSPEIVFFYCILQKTLKSNFRFDCLDILHDILPVLLKLILNIHMYRYVTKKKHRLS